MDKFTETSIYFKSDRDFVQSIISEIENILSCRLDPTLPIEESPFSYGTKDLESINTASEDLNAFGSLCRRAILHFEPRLDDLEITDVKIDRETQTISLEIVCYPKRNDLTRFSTLLTRRTY
ncbi:MAG: GPW/gp25 family protein [Holosporales bacterium]|nr:GPW/gp25 family protein [Holosporales bacterium]